MNFDLLMRRLDFRFVPGGSVVLWSLFFVSLADRLSANPKPAKAAAAASASPQVALDEPMPDSIEAFLRDQCLDCHDGPSGEAGFDLASLSRDLSDRGTAKRWARALERVEKGEMPPPEGVEADDKQRERFVEALSGHLIRVQKATFDLQGRVRGRRLTNEQIERSLHHLLCVDLPLASLIPEEPRSEGFEGLAHQQQMSHFHLQSHLKMVDAALDEAWRRLFEGKPIHKDLDATEIADKKRGRRNREPELYQGAAVGWNSTLPFYTRISSTRVSESGWYDIELTASGLNVPEKDSEGGQGIWCAVRSGRCVSSAPLLFWIGDFELSEEPQTWKFRGYIEDGHQLEIRPLDTRLKRARFSGGQVGAGEGQGQGAPGLAMHSIEMTQVFPGGDHRSVRETLFGDLPIDMKWRQRTAILDGSVDDSRDRLHEQVRRFARRAFRVAAPPETLDRYVAFFEATMADGEEPIRALRSTYRAILCSPRFLFFQESPGTLSDEAFAVRLAYFLNGSPPDEELMSAAMRNELRTRDQIAAQVDRMLDGDGLATFVGDLADRWLDLSQIDFTEPDRRLHRSFDPIVQNAMIEETHAFLRHVLARNRPVAELVDADYTFLNSRLADYYGIEGVQGDEIRKVTVGRDDHRGGLLTQGAILKVTAAGNETSPVLRGVWISERILGCEIPPPPAGVPAVEPDTRGAKTIRDLLQKHLADPSCAACHRDIDPPGYALENFDAAGQWRTRYPKGNRPGQGGPIDPSFVLADGQAFDDFETFRKLVASDPEQLARNFAAKLLVYGTGETIQFADRQALDEIVRRVKSPYRLRDLLIETVSSDSFRRK